MWLNVADVNDPGRTQAGRRPDCEPEKITGRPPGRAPARR